MGCNLFPPWLKKRWPASEEMSATWEVLRKHGVGTVCEGAHCPNLGECFARRTATFMILGSICTRNCRFCAVPHGHPTPPDPEEPARIAQAAAQLGLAHVVVTSVTRDDLPDQGAGQFAATVQALRQILPQATVEVLTPDFGGREELISLVAGAGPDIYNHNLETVPRLYALVRPGADYRRSLNLLRLVKASYPQLLTKSGLMVGLGEDPKEVRAVIQDLRLAGCDSLTIGQYLQPTPAHLPVAEFITPEQFQEYQRWGQEAGFMYVATGPFVRSSYHADQAAAQCLGPGLGVPAAKG